MSHPRISVDRLGTLRGLLDAGKTLREAGAAIGVTRQRAMQIAAKYGIPHRVYQRRKKTAAQIVERVKRHWLGASSGYPRPLA